MFLGSSPPWLRADPVKCCTYEVKRCSGNSLILNTYQTQDRPEKDEARCFARVHLSRRCGGNPIDHVPCRSKLRPFVSLLRHTTEIR